MTHKTSLSDRLQQVMTESRMIVPGAQAVLGFQFVYDSVRPRIFLSHSHHELPDLVGSDYP